MERMLRVTYGRPYGSMRNVSNAVTWTTEEEPLVLKFATFDAPEKAREVSLELLAQGSNTYTGFGEVKVGPARKGLKRFIGINFKDEVLFTFERKDLYPFLLDYWSHSEDLERKVLLSLEKALEELSADPGKN